MVKLNKIYTRTGDTGETGLGTGARLPKHHPRITAVGSVDETSSFIGIARLHAAAAGLAAMDADLARIQNDLFDLGADLTMPTGKDGAQKQGKALRIVPEQVSWLEKCIDALNENLQPLRSFVLPGGSAAAAHLHVARAVCRRAERDISTLAAIPGEHVNPLILAYVNRLSDYLFVAARFANASDGQGDVLWRPGAGRDNPENEGQT